MSIVLAGAAYGTWERSPLAGTVGQCSGAKDRKRKRLKKMKEILTNLTIDDIATYLGYVVAALTAAMHVYLAHRQGKTVAETLIILANTLKDESKMPGGTFSPETIKKAEEFATTIQADDKAIEQVKEVLSGRELDLKLGSFKGKPIYLSDALKLGGLASALGKLVKKK